MLINFHPQKDHQVLAAPLRRPWTITQVRYNPGAAGYQPDDDYPVQLVARLDDDQVLDVTGERIWPKQWPPPSVPLAVNDPRRARGVLWEDPPPIDILPMAGPVLVPAGAVLELAAPIPGPQPSGIEITYDERT